MPTREILREHWVEFFHGFSRAHQGWLATVEVIGSDLGAQVEARELPFEGITAAPRSNTIALILGESPESHLTHSIAGATHVRLNETEYGESEVLQIEAPGQAMTLIRFRPPMSADAVAGVIIE